jgi:stress-induced morphogen
MSQVRSVPITFQLSSRPGLHRSLPHFTDAGQRSPCLAGGCGAFYAIAITSSAFQGLTMVKQHRLVTDALKAEIEGIHGLQASI